MELLTKYNGAVLFVDLLGMGALTKEQIPLQNEDYETWLQGHAHERSNQFLAAAVLVEFRKLLGDFVTRHPSVTISQLSDCAFIWSQDAAAVVVAAAALMQAAIRRGLLCRGGLAYGEIIVTNQNHSLGRLIVGKAVTEAVKLEGASKGARILVNDAFFHSLWTEAPEFAARTRPLFAPLTNPLDFVEYDEFRWYLVPEKAYRDGVDVRSLSAEKRLAFTKCRLKLANEVRCSPKFRWNAATREGLVQVQATIKILSQNNALNVSHNFDWNGVVANRSQGIVDSINRTIESESDYVCS